MEVLRFIGSIQFLNGLSDEVEHGFVGHGVTQDVGEHFGDEERDGAFVR